MRSSQARASGGLLELGADTDLLILSVSLPERQKSPKRVERADSVADMGVASMIGVLLLDRC
jgi:hypothetical protein